MPEIIVSRRKTKGNHVAFVLETESPVSANVAPQRQQCALGVFSHVCLRSPGVPAGWARKVVICRDSRCLYLQTEPVRWEVWSRDTRRFIAKTLLFPGISIPLAPQSVLRPSETAEVQLLRIT